jgi:hypothetical protein
MSGSDNASASARTASSSGGFGMIQRAGARRSEAIDVTVAS